MYSAPRSNTRSAFTYVCLVADDLDIQKALPQVLMVSKKVVSAIHINAIRTMLPPSIHIWHMDFSWTTTDKMIALMKMLTKSLAGKIEDRQIILTADCFRAHITQPVWKACKAHKIFYAVIPSKMTWALQPCDTHVFASLKRNLQQKCQEAMLARGDGALTTESLFTSWQRASQKWFARVPGHMLLETLAYWEINVASHYACCKSWALQAFLWLEVNCQL